MKIRFSTPQPDFKSNITETQVHLQSTRESQIYSLLSYFCGYNSWSSHIKYLHSELLQPQSKSNSNYNYIPKERKDELSIQQNTSALIDQYKSIVEEYKSELQDPPLENEHYYLCHLQLFFHPETILYLYDPIKCSYSYCTSLLHVFHLFR